MSKSLRSSLEHYVCGWNTALEEVVSKMDVIILLRNAHPAYRAVYASELKEAGVISPDEATEFMKGPNDKKLMQFR